MDKTFIEMGLMDRLSEQDTPIHRLDARAKLLSTILFVVAVVSFGRYEISALLPFAIYPIVLASLADVPGSFLLRRMLLVAPFAFCLGILNPVIDHQPMWALGGVVLSGGWISFFSIMLRFILTVSAALVLLASTGIHQVCMGLERLGTPRVFVVQLLFLYRYLFVLVDEGRRMVRARAVRSFDRRGMGLRVYSHMLGTLLVRTLDRAQRIHLAMTCRGFGGHVRSQQQLSLHRRDVFFVVGWAGLFIVMRWYPVSRWIGSVFMEVFQ